MRGRGGWTLGMYALWGAGECLNQAALDVTGLPPSASARDAFWHALPLRVAVAVALGVALGLGVRLLLWGLGRRRPQSQHRLARVELWLSWPVALAAGGGLGLLPQTGFVLQLACWVATALLGVMWALRQAPAGALEPERASPALGPLPWLFFGSGLAALIYQVVWQRTLFSLVGLNVESTTLVVAIFMLGLGLGGLVGGRLSTAFPERAAELFLTIELGVAVFAAVSLPLLHATGRALAHAGLALTAMAVAGLLLVPTLFMGATLPILTGHLSARRRSLGSSVAPLYAINTLGSAVACFLTADLLFVWFGQSGAVAFGVGCNLVVGALVFRFIRRTRAVAP